MDAKEPEDKEGETVTEQPVETKKAEPEPEDEDKGGRFMLLERLFRFVRTKEQLNPVLSGYFAKLVTLLINRKQRVPQSMSIGMGSRGDQDTQTTTQRLLIPFVFQPSSDVLDCLLFHVY